MNLIHKNEPFVAFVGAGVSALPPSSLPTWTEFNNLLLECLCERLAEYSQNRQPTDEMLSTFRQRRDQTRFLAPDFQAQLIEEEVGPRYFKVWQSLETNAYGPVHAALAELSEKGRLAAIVTTNFDRLIEMAMKGTGQAFEVFHDRRTFEALAAVGARKHTSALPVIKIHGSIEDASSLVDTLKQRLVGRPQSLEKALQVLLRKYRWLYLGVSGADFTYDPHYLGILDEAADAKGFIFLTRKDSEIQEGVRVLVEAYGPEKAAIVHGELPTWLSDNFGLTPRQLSPSVIVGKDDPKLRVRGRVRQWVEDLGPIAVVNILYSMLKSSGMEPSALWLLRKTWKSYRSPRDTQSKSYGRYNYNYGTALLEIGYIRSSISLSRDMSNYYEWKEQADQNAYEYLARGYGSGKLLAAGGRLACVLAYRGEIGKAISLVSRVTEEALAQKSMVDLCDISITSAIIYDIVQMFRAPVEQFRHCLRIAKKVGDEPRRALLCAHLGRFLTYSANFGDADKFINEADRIGQRLDMRSILLISQAARGLWLAESGTSAERAVRMLRELVDAIDTLDDVPLVTKFDLFQPNATPNIIRSQNPILCRVLLDLNRAALFADDIQVMNQTLDRLDQLVTDVFLGYCPHYYLSYVQCLLTHGDESQQGLVRDLISKARLLGEESQNPWVAQAADHLERQIGSEP